MDEMQEIIQDFIVEAQETLENLDQNFIQLEKNPNDMNLINLIFRAVHTLKGTAGFLGFNKLVEVAHAAENLLNRLRQGKFQLTPEVIDIILEAKDIIKKLVDEIKSGQDNNIDISTVMIKLDLLLEMSAEPVQPQEPKKETEVMIAEPDILITETIVIDQPVVAEVKKKDSESCSLGAETEEDKKKTPVKESSESKVTVENNSAISQGNKEKDDRQKEKTSSGSEQNERHGDIEQTVRVEAKRLDQVMNLVGELVLNRNRLIKLSSELEKTHEEDMMPKEISRTVAQLNLVTTDLQLAVMRTRMIPISKVLNKFPRMVRDLSRKVSKKVNLEMFGEDTELDKSVVEEIGDPLLHIIRNSIDHGIESIEERIAKGKPEEGNIKLSAYQEGNNIVIEIEDDGKGIDPERIRRKALDKKLINEKEAERISNEELIELIFLPGFSTAEKVTDVSGRGVGMDVVKTNIGKINGHVEIKSKVNIGTKIIIKLPLTIAIIQALIVMVEKEVFAIPLASIIETVKITPHDLKTIDGAEVLKIRDIVIPILRLGREFEIESNEKNKEKYYVVILALSDRRIGILVDRLYRQEEVVIKSMGDYLSNIKGISGATITGEGKVVLILDIPDLMMNLKSVYRR